MRHLLRILLLGLALIGSVAHVEAKSYLAVDRHAQNAPKVSSEIKLKQVVKYLTGPFSDDENKARAIYAWIVYHIDYDTYKFNVFLDNQKRGRSNAVPEVDSILKTHAGICEDIAPLFVKMAQYAGLEAVTITGIAANNMAITRRTADEFAHVWAAVKINGDWEYVDPTWAIGSNQIFSNITNDVAYRRQMKARVHDDKTYEARKDRSVSNEWFMTDKDEMIKTHFPDDDRWQLQKRHISRNRFLRKTQ